MKPKTLQPVYIIRKKVTAHAGHHGGAWKVAYADFVTAMMAFFMVMWLVNQDPSVKKQIAGYFKDPGVFAQQRSLGLLSGGKISAEQGAGTRTPMKASTDDSVRSQERTLAKAAEGMKSAIESMSDAADLRNQVEFSLTSEGLRVELVDRPGSGFFSSGSSAPRPEAELLLKKIAVELAKLDNEVVIEGHTDSQPFSPTALKDNWDLSTERALAAKRVMVAGGLRPDMVTAIKGFADKELHVVDDPKDPRNRRVSILVHSRDAAAIADKLRASKKE